MATVSERFEASRQASLTAAIDRWIYVFMAGLFVVTALAGFVPASIAKVTAMQAGERPWFPEVAHVHAVLMGAWLSLLLVQAWLMATGRPAVHRKLGLLAVALVPAMIVAGILLVMATHAQLAESRAGAPPGALRTMLDANANSANNIMLAQIRIAIMFGASVGIALAVRRSDAGLHKRLMFLGTASLLPPAFARIAFLPNTIPDSYLAQDFYTLLVVSPMLLWDLYRQRRVHRAYLIWLSLFVPLSLAVLWLWNHPAWMSLAPRIVGTA